MTVAGAKAIPYKMSGGGTQSDYEVGRVRASATKTIVLDLNVEGSAVESDSGADYVLRLNGRVIKRMTYPQARRMLGLGDNWATA